MAVETSLEWVNRLHRRGETGLPAWAKETMDRTLYFTYEKCYPEVTGYFIPTLIKYGRKGLAERLALWLLSQQNEDGSFNNMEGQPETFDTGMVCLGLHHINLYLSSENAFWTAYNKCVDYLRNEMIVNNQIMISPRRSDTQIYLIKVCAVIGEHRPVTVLLPKEHMGIWKKERLHYVAYGLEGLDHLGYRGQVDTVLTLLEESLPSSLQDGIVPWNFTGNEWNSPTGSDTCATAQLAALLMKYNKDRALIEEMVEGVRNMKHEKGGIYHAIGDKRLTTWTLKYYLDMEMEYKRWAK